MIPIVIATHGGLGKALLDTAELILGGPQGDVCVVALTAEDDLEAAKAKIKGALQAARTGTGPAEARPPLVLVDLFGGTASNAAAWASEGSELEIVAGVNLPMLLEVLLHRERMSARELAQLAVRAGQQGIVDVGAMIAEPLASAGSDARSKA